MGHRRRAVEVNMEMVERTGEHDKGCCWCERVGFVCAVRGSACGAAWVA